MRCSVNYLVYVGKYTQKQLKKYFEIIDDLEANIEWKDYANDMYNFTGSETADALIMKDLADLSDTINKIKAACQSAEACLETWK